MSYRERIYKNYLRNDEPKSLAELAPRRAYLLKVISEHFPVNRDAKILDLGCGHGAILHFAKQAGYTQVKGIDVSPSQVALANKFGIQEVEQGDLLGALRSQVESAYDLVISFDVIEHFTKDELIRFVDEVRRVLRTSGKWIIHVPNGESPFGTRIRYGDFSHELCFTRNSIRQLLFASGFSDVLCYEDKPVVHGLKSAVRAILWKFIRIGLRIYLIIETGSGEKEGIFSQNFLVVAVK